MPPVPTGGSELVHPRLSPGSSHLAGSGRCSCVNPGWNILHSYTSLVSWSPGIAQNRGLHGLSTTNIYMDTPAWGSGGHIRRVNGLRSCSGAQEQRLGHLYQARVSPSSPCSLTAQVISKHTEGQNNTGMWSTASNNIFSTIRQPLL